MRQLLFTLAVLVFSTVPNTFGDEAITKLPASVKIFRQPDAGSLLPSTRMFEVDCKIVSKRLSFSIPTITIHDTEKATIADTTTTSHVIAHKLERGQLVPVTREVVEGTTATMTVMAVDERQVVLDFSLLLQGKSANTKRYLGQHRQIIECVPLGEKVECEIDAESHFEVKVTEVARQAEK